MRKTSYSSSRQHYAYVLYHKAITLAILVYIFTKYTSFLYKKTKKKKHS